MTWELFQKQLCTVPCRRYVKYIAIGDKCQFFNIFFWIFIHSAVIVKSCKT